MGLVQQRSDVGDQVIAGHGFLGARIPGGQEHGGLGDVLRADFCTQGDSPLDVLPVLLAAADVAIIDDFRDLLGREEIDGVTISTPDGRLPGRRIVVMSLPLCPS